MAFRFRDSFRKKHTAPQDAVEIPTDIVGTAALPGDLEAIRSRIEELLAHPFDLEPNGDFAACMAIGLEADSVPASDAMPEPDVVAYPTAKTRETASPNRPLPRIEANTIHRGTASGRRGAQTDLAGRLAKLDAGFSETVLALIDTHGATDAQIYRRANLTRQHFAKIRKDPRYRPTKKTALALAIALELDLDETLDLIGRAGYTLSHASKFDIIVEYFIMCSVFDIGLINETLYEFDQPLLGS